MPLFHDRPFKTMVRNEMLSYVEPAKSLITLPGQEILCIKRMLELGIITSETQQVWIERYPEVAQKMGVAARAMEAQLVVGDIRKWTPTRPFDLLNLDLEEGFTARLGLWFETMAAPLVMERASFLITMTTASRNKEAVQFGKWFDTRCVVDPRLARGMVEILRFSNHRGESLRRTALLIACAMKNTHRINLLWSKEYKDGVPMFAVHLKARAIPEPIDLPSLTELRAGFFEVYDPVTFDRRPSELREDEKLERELEMIEARAEALREELAKRRRSADYHERGKKAGRTRRANKAAAEQGLSS